MKHKIDEYDKQNGTELARFVAYLERGKILQQNESRYFYVANAGKLLSKYGIKGIITTSTQTVNRRHSKDIDHLTVDERIDTILSINNPIAITLYGDDENSYRIYTFVVKNSKNICVGIDMKNLGHHVEIAKVKTGHVDILGGKIRAKNH
jgi:2-methylisocitrate lyase-like PEP mutase family enzyme